MGQNSGKLTQLGLKVNRAAADVFDGTTTALFTISGGRVFVTHIEAEVTVANVDVTTSNTKFISNPTVGVDLDLCAILNITGDIVGAVYTITGTFADALTGGIGGGAVGMTAPVVVPEGTIDLSSSADAGTGGALGKFEIWYLPLDAGATIVAV